MKKLKKLIAVAISIMIHLCSCETESESITRNEANTDGESMFVVVESTLYWNVVYCKETKVMYTVSSSSRNYGNFTLLVNPDGSPMLWEGEE